MRRIRYTGPALSGALALALVGAVATTAGATTGGGTHRPPVVGSAARSAQGPADGHGTASAWGAIDEDGVMIAVVAGKAGVDVSKGAGAPASGAVVVAGPDGGPDGGKGACPAPGSLPGSVPGALPAPPSGPPSRTGRGAPAGAVVGPKRLEVRDGAVYVDGKKVATLPDGDQGPVLVLVKDGKVYVGDEAKKMAPSLPALPAVPAGKAGTVGGKPGDGPHLVCSVHVRPATPGATADEGGSDESGAPSTHGSSHRGTHDHSGPGGRERSTSAA